MAKFILNYAAIRVKTSEVGVKIVRDAMRSIAVLAKAYTVGPYSQYNLARHIETRGPEVLPDRVRGSVGVWGVPYAAAVEVGAEAHVIRPRGNYDLVFFWDKVGHVVRLRKVNHPGQRGKRYLERALREVAAARRMRVRSR